MLIVREQVQQVLSSTCSSLNPFAFFSSVSINRRTDGAEETCDNDNDDDMSVAATTTLLSQLSDAADSLPPRSSSSPKSKKGVRIDESLN